MTKQIVITPKASLDIDDYFAYISQSNYDVALDFFDAVRETFAQLAKMPGIGSYYKIDNPRLQELRKWPVKRFKKYLVFYLEKKENIQVLRVLYAGRDIERILEQEY
ncbi:type II toxin-antitoxin system RelE/ParE family toxin [Nostoc sp. TCL26-01]|uniref:type II toxin-antitoxin system RelE/ParE family toxin n=1 Tax=Nostoc sp. TCL26-01 TaxID=2576904 RepID=UPI0015C0D543|nr:type II toxin-antitoxin system RelE/ParE family toxin [Nostoc sp. TCL26-01]QLE58719.1 type II toxin-antitoxin system RelE/ParE family toxin [Nostoc sp. TCL26-01]